MTLKLDPASAKQIRTLCVTEAPTIIEMAREIGVDIGEFFKGEDWSGLDLRPCDLSGVSFAGAVMDGVVIYDDQLGMIVATGPRSMSLPVVCIRDSYSELEKFTTVNAANNDKNSEIDRYNLAVNNHALTEKLLNIKAFMTSPDRRSVV